MDFEKYLVEYTNLSRTELEKIRDYASNQEDFDFKVRSVHLTRENEKIKGRPAVRPRPLVNILSVCIKPKTDGEDKTITVYGRINYQYSNSVCGDALGHDLYNRDRKIAEILDTSGRLTLNGPDYLCYPNYSFIPLFRNSINMDLLDGDDNVIARGCFSLDDNENEGGYEEVKYKCIPCEQGSVIVEYVAIPFGVNCRLEITFHNRNVSKKLDYINLNGKVVASFDNTYGNYSSQECILFQKPSNSFERVEIDRSKMQLLRSWVAVPAYSSLVVGLDFSEFATGRKLVYDKIKLLPQPGHMFGDLFVLDDLFIQVRVAWFSPTPLGLNEGNAFSQPQKFPASIIPQRGHKKENDMELDYKTSSDDESTSDVKVFNPRWGLHCHKSKPWPSPAVEIFSVFIGRESARDLQIYGDIKVLSDGRKICCIFKRDEKDPLRLSEHMNTLAIPDGSRLYEDFNPLEMEVNIKDDEGRLAVKGYLRWDADKLDGPFYRDRLLCGFIQGQDGFVAVHYSIFSSSVYANVKVFLDLKTGCDVYPKVFGSLISQYCCFDYSSRYYKDHYRCVLFTRSQDDSVQIDIDGSIPLSRSLVAVPTYSSLILNVDISTGLSAEKCSCTEVFEVGDDSKTIEASEYTLRIEFSTLMLLVFPEVKNTLLSRTTSIKDLMNQWGSLSKLWHVYALSDGELFEMKQQDVARYHMRSVKSLRSTLGVLCNINHDKVFKEWRKKNRQVCDKMENKVRILREKREVLLPDDEKHGGSAQ